MDISREMGRKEVGSAKERACGGLLFVVYFLWFLSLRESLVGAGAQRAFV